MPSASSPMNAASTSTNGATAQVVGQERRIRELQHPAERLRTRPGRSSIQSRQAVRTSVARSIGQKSAPGVDCGIGKSSNSSAVTAATFPPPPRMRPEEVGFGVAVGVDQPPVGQ